MKPQKSGERIDIYEWPNGCEIYEKHRDKSVMVQSPQDVRMLIKSLSEYLNVIPVEFGGNKVG